MHTDIQDFTAPDTEPGSDDTYAYVHTVARVAIYDDVRSAPRIIEIQPDKTDSYVANLTTEIYNHVKLFNGSIPYTVIKEVVENFIHARFKEVVVSILDEGNTIRFSDHGPGIVDKDRALLPGFSSATEDMKQFIRGVGSGLPLVVDWVDMAQGVLTIEDNLGSGAVITISIQPHNNSVGSAHSNKLEAAQSSEPSRDIPSQPGPETQQPEYIPDLNRAVYSPAAAGFPQYYAYQPIPVQGVQGQPIYALPQQPYQAYVPSASYAAQPAMYITPGSSPIQAPTGQASEGVTKQSIRTPRLTERERTIILLLAREDSLGITDIFEMTNIPRSSISNLFNKLELAGLVMATKPKGHRMLTDFGIAVAHTLSTSA